jgi:hypothetical protein
LGVTVLDVGAFGEGIDPSVVAIEGAEVMFTVTDLAFSFEGFITAAMARDGDAVFGGIDS